MLKVVLVVVGLIFCGLAYPLMMFVKREPALAMMLSVYVTLGIFLLRAARNPLDHLSLIWFTVWSSLVHGGIMTVQAIVQPGQRGHLVGDVPALFLVAMLLALLTPRVSGSRRLAGDPEEQVA